MVDEHTAAGIAYDSGREIAFPFKINFQAFAVKLSGFFKISGPGQTRILGIRRRRVIRRKHVFRRPVDHSVQFPGGISALAVFSSGGDQCSDLLPAQSGAEQFIIRTQERTAQNRGTETEIDFIFSQISDTFESRFQRRRQRDRGNVQDPRLPGKHQ